MVRTIAIGMFLAAGLSIAAAGQNRDDNWARCSGDDPNTTINACTTLIQGGQETSDDLANAYFNRARAYSHKSEFDQAIEDDNRALKLNPNQAHALLNRGISYGQRGQYDRAIADFDRYIALKPGEAHGYYNRGIAYGQIGQFDRALQDLAMYVGMKPGDASGYYYRGTAYEQLGQYEHAIADYDKAIRIKPNAPMTYMGRGYARVFLPDLPGAVADFEHILATNPSEPIAIYAALWLHMANHRQGQDDAPQLAQAATKADLRQWPGPLLQLYLGQITADQAQVAAMNPDPEKQKNQLCETNFYSGEDALSHQQKATALAHLRIARDTCPKGNFEYEGAIAELKLLDATAR